MNPVLMTKFIFGIMLFIGAIVLMQMGLYVFHQISGIPLEWNVFQYCLTVIQEDTIGHDITKLLFNLLILYTIARMVSRISRQLILSRKWMRMFRSFVHSEHTTRLNDQYQEWNTEIIVVQDTAFIALSIGIVRPRIIISTGVIDLFSEQEVRAILLHEWYHCRSLDPFQMFLTTLMTDSMGYIPLMNTLAHHFKTWKELLADRFAVTQMETEYYLGNVLLKISTFEKMHHRAETVSFANTAINYRILQVLQVNQPVKVPIPYRKPLFFTITLLFVMTGIIAGGCS